MSQKKWYIIFNAESKMLKQSISLCISFFFPSSFFTSFSEGKTDHKTLLQRRALLYYSESGGISIHREAM